MRSKLTFKELNELIDNIDKIASNDQYNFYHNKNYKNEPGNEQELRKEAYYELFHEYGIDRLAIKFGTSEQIMKTIYYASQNTETTYELIGRLCQEFETSVISTKDAEKVAKTIDNVIKNNLGIKTMTAKKRKELITTNFANENKFLVDKMNNEIRKAMYPVKFKLITKTIKTSLFVTNILFCYLHDNSGDFSADSYIKDIKKELNSEAATALFNFF